MKVLYITANPKKVEDSASLQVGEAFIEVYKEKNPNDEVVVFDLYKQNISFLQMADMMPQGDKESKIEEMAKYFSSFDKYVIATPMWNLSIPSILKAYIDNIVVSKVTFKYTQYGFPVGLLKDKKVAFILSRGGVYSFWPVSKFAFDEKYLKCIFKFIGVKKQSVLAVEKLELHQDKRKEIIQKAVQQAQKLAQKF